MKRDEIDFGKMRIPDLFFRLFVPTLTAQVFFAAFTIVDGVVVGRGVGSDALAAVNIASPIYLITTSVALMFGSGISIVAAIHLSKGNFKAANINVTQAISVVAFLMFIFSLVVFFFARPLCFLFGGSEYLCPLVVEYLRWVSPSPILDSLLIVGNFTIRLDGEPSYAMRVGIVSAVLNSVLDYLCVFPLGMGLAGAGFATSLSMLVAVLMSTYYLLRKSKTLHFYRPKFSAKALRLTLRNVGYMAKVGFPSFIGEMAIICMLICGNYTFIRDLGEDGVAAFGICCYLFPLIFMFGYSIAQAQMPIISYNYGLGDTERVRRTVRLSTVAAVAIGTVMTVAGLLFAGSVASMFLASGTPAHDIAAAGLPLFSFSFLLVTLNLVMIGYFQSVKRTRVSIFFMLQRGLIFVIPCFLILPPALGTTGLWLAVPVSELLTLTGIASFLLISSRGGTSLRGSAL